VALRPIGIIRRSLSENCEIERGKSKSVENSELIVLIELRLRANIIREINMFIRSLYFIITYAYAYSFYLCKFFICVQKVVHNQSSSFVSKFVI
jgi:hypothetical protein